MSFFKRRSNRNAADEASGGSSQAQSIESLRKSARHRLIGATVLVVISVIGFPLLFDTQPRPVKSDIQIEIADRDKVSPSQAPSAVKSPADKLAGADKAGATKTDSSSDKLKDSSPDSDKGTYAESGKAAEARTSNSQASSTSTTVGAVGAVGAVAAAGVAAQKFTSNISALTTPAAPSSSPSPSVLANNVANTNTAAAPSPAQAAGTSQAEKSKGGEPKEVIISTKAPDAKVASALSNPSSATPSPAPISTSATSAKSTNSAANTSASSSALSSTNAAPAPSVSAASKSTKPTQDKESKKEGKDGKDPKDVKDTKESKDTKPVRQLIQVGVFTDPAKVREHKARLEKAGFSVLTHSETAKDGTKRIRLRVGPYKTHDEAQRNLERVKEMKIQGAQLNLIPLSK
jgi:DedD protein